ncbi:MAG: dihydropteroate synthase DHPS [Burkholderiales bacterium RIFCSPHIGHO2_12_FULL_61_11]|nr:MAG: dihydropteroate synthase DHPS [Burkholderiales bacterium RIFCSPHIGHO2_12_FULL_61_11]
MSNPNSFAIKIIGERINPGFKSTKAMFEEKDLASIQALAIRQVESGAIFLNVNLGAQAMTDRPFLIDVIHAIQSVVDVPLSFDVPSVELTRLCLATYDRERTGGALPIVNSITEHRWDAMTLYKQYPFKVMVMASESVVDGVAKNNKTAGDIASTAKRAALRLRDDYGMPLDDIYIDLSVSAIIADTEGLNRATLDAVRLIGGDTELQGLHMTGGLSNIGQQMPAKAADGSDLKHCLENAFLTLAVPYGFDTVLGTPWRGYAPLPEDHYVLKAYRNFLEQSGSNALRAVRKFYKA